MEEHRWEAAPGRVWKREAAGGTVFQPDSLEREAPAAPGLEPETERVSLAESPLAEGPEKEPGPADPPEADRAEKTGESILKDAAVQAENQDEAEAGTETEKAETEPRKPLSNEAVTEHTASLWKYLPIPGTEPEPAPEYMRLRREFEGGTITAARVRGKKHKHEGSNCDDWFEAAGFRDLLFAAVSDGAGSRKFSRVGARESCRAAVGCLRRELESLWTPELAEDAAQALGDPRCMAACTALAGAVQRSVLKAREAVEAAFYTRVLDPAYEAALGRPLDLRDFSATLLVTAVIPAGEGGRLVISCQVGDGMMALLDTKGPLDGSVKLMGTADSGAFSGETEFLTSPQMASLEALQSRTKLSWGRSDLLLMMSDGVADDYFPGGTELRRLYFDLIANGVLEGRGAGELTEERLRLCRKLPQPLSYPWVNDQTVQVPLHYTRRILETAGLTLEDLWNDGTALAAARAELEGQLALPDPAQRLERWLDNYVERGSFDDRTLLIAEL